MTAVASKDGRTPCSRSRTQPLPMTGEEGQTPRCLRRDGRRRLRGLVSVVAVVLAIGMAGTQRVNATVPGQNGRIAFASNRAGPPFDLYTMASDGANVVRLTTSGGSDPAWSPDGSRVAYVSFRDGAGHPEIFVIDADGQHETRLTSPPTMAGHPSWSPDGTRIAFASYEPGSGTQDIYVMNVDGSGRQRLTTDPADDTEPSWAPTGDALAFVSYRNAQSDGNFELYVMHPDGSNQTRLTSTPDAEVEPDWSPDGTTIAYRLASALGSTVHVVKSDGTGDAPIAAGWEPHWTPDGGGLLVTNTDLSGQPDVFFVALDGTVKARLTDDPADDIGAAWQTVGFTPPTTTTQTSTTTTSGPASTATTSIGAAPGSSGSPSGASLPPQPTTVGPRFTG